jgi:anti-sigma B factor antagonist
MEIRTESRGDVSVITLSGTIDAVTALELNDAIKACASQKLVLDLSKVHYLSSAGIQALLQGVKNARAQSGDLRAVGVRGDVKKILEISGVIGLIKQFPNVETAVASYEEPLASEA